MLKNKFVILFMVAALTLALLTGCTETHNEPLVRPEISEVVTTTLALEQTPVWYKVNGMLKAETVSTIASRIMGDVKQIHVKKGERIKKGQLLVTIDNRDMLQRVKAAEESHSEAMRNLESATEQSLFAEKTFNRLKDLYAGKALSEQEYDKANTERKVRNNELERARSMLKRTEAALEEARLYLGYTKVVAPLDSVVIKTHVDSGSLATPGAPLLTIEDPSAFKLETNIDARYQSVVKEGMAVDVLFESIDEACTAYVARVIPNINLATRTFPVEIKSGSSKPEGMRTGLYAKVRFKVGDTRKLLIPRDALVKKGQLEGVYVVGEDKVVLYRLIRTGQSYDNKIEVIAGLTEGDRIIVQGTDAAVDGGIIKE